MCAFRCLPAALLLTSCLCACILCCCIGNLHLHCALLPPPSCHAPAVLQASSPCCQTQQQPWQQQSSSGGHSSSAHPPATAAAVLHHSLPSALLERSSMRGMWWCTQWLTRKRWVCAVRWSVKRCTQGCTAISMCGCLSQWLAFPALQRNGALRCCVNVVWCVLLLSSLSGSHPAVPQPAGGLGGVHHAAGSGHSAGRYGARGNLEYVRVCMCRRSHSHSVRYFCMCVR